MSVTRITLPPRCAGGVYKITPSGTGSCVPLFDDGAPSVVHRPARTGAPGATAAVGSSVSETMYESPAAFTPVTVRRTFPGMSVLLFVAAPQPAGPLPATTCGAHLRAIARSGNLDVEQWRILLRAEEIALVGAGVRRRAEDQRDPEASRRHEHRLDVVTLPHRVGCRAVRAQRIGPDVGAAGIGDDEIGAHAAAALEAGLLERGRPEVAGRRDDADRLHALTPSSASVAPARPRGPVGRDRGTW